MFAGKTTWLLTTKGTHILWIKHQMDTRFSSHSIVSHDGASQSAISCTRLHEVDVTPFDTICVDEGHFFDDLDLLDQWANQGKKVYVALLLSDHQRQAFPTIQHIIAQADEMIVLQATCSCGQKAPFTKRLVPSGSTGFQVGGKELYQPQCRKCFYSSSSP